MPLTLDQPPKRPPLIGMLSRAAAKKVASVLRSFHVATIHPGWQARAEICARCPVAVRDGPTVYCGKPFLSQLHRLPAQGCGCPVLDKSQDPSEHCPLTRTLEPKTETGPCDCKWCHGSNG